MREPSISIGFIIFNPRYETEIKCDVRGHYWTARNWIENNNLEELYQEIRNNPENNIWDYEDFLINYIGAVKLYATRGQKIAYIPKNTSNNAYKSLIKRHYKEEGYTISGNFIEESSISKRNEYPSLKVEYYRTIIPIKELDGKEKYVYNPYINGD